MLANFERMMATAASMIFWYSAETFCSWINCALISCSSRLSRSSASSCSSVWRASVSGGVRVFTRSGLADAVRFQQGLAGGVAATLDRGLDLPRVGGLDVVVVEAGRGRAR